MTSPDYSQIRDEYEAAGQAHVFKFWDSLNDEQRQLLVNQLKQINPRQVTEIAKRTLAPKSPSSSQFAKDTILPLPKISFDSLLDSEEPKIDAWRQKGLQAIGENKVGVILLSGGQGTRLGSSAPKGCYDVGLPSHKSLFQLQAERIIKIADLASKATGNSNVVIPWYIMTSGPTRKPIEEYFRQNKYFGLDSSNIVFFEQGILPCLTPEGSIIMEDKYKVAVAPDGNGGIYNALFKHGILMDIKQRGIEHIHTYCVDNCLVRVADPVFIGYAMEKDVDIATKVVRKRDASEKVGLIVSKNNAPGVIEYSEISAQLASATEEHDATLLKFRAANIVNHYYSSKFLLNIPNWESSYLPFHIANKKVPYIDLETGEKVTKPPAPNGVKMEQFVFDVFPGLGFDKFACLEVNRLDEFSPLKNGPGSDNDCPETSRHDLLAQAGLWLKNAGAANEPEVEVSPLTSYAGEGLESFKNKKLVSLTTI